LAVVGGVIENLQIILGAAAFVAAFAKPVVSDAETRRREQIVAIRVIGEGTGLAHE
jgi:hypothetical protein